MADGDKDKPQITQSSNSNEISPLDSRSISPLAQGFGQLGPSDALDKLAASAAAGRAAYDEAQRDQAAKKAGGISRAPSPPPPISGNNYSPKPPEHPPHRDESVRGDLMREVEESERKRAEKAPDMPANPEPEAAKPMHARDRRLYVVLAWTAIPAALIVGCSVAWGSRQLSGLWASVGVFIGLATMSVALGLRGSMTITGHWEAVPAYMIPARASVM
jgi:hypothetical protein